LKRKEVIVVQNPYTIDMFDAYAQFILTEKDKKKRDAFFAAMYKVPRYRQRRLPTKSLNALIANSDRRFNGAYYGPYFANKDKFVKNSYLYGDYRIFSDDLERSWDYVRNPKYDLKVWKEPSDTGSEFLTYRVGWENHIDVQNVDIWTYNSPYWRRWKGNISANPDNIIVDGRNIFTVDHQMPPTEDYDITSWGPTAWNRFKPAKPTLDLAQFIGEARDLPRLLYAKLEGLKTIADVYIAARFGWEPLLRDIIDMCKFVDKFSEQVEFFYQNAGKPVHRKGTVTTKQTVDLVQDAHGVQGNPGISSHLDGRAYPSWPGGLHEPYHQQTIRKYKQTIYFNGTFVFWFDGKPPERDTLIARLAGLEVTPRVVWEVLPWSWLIDYFSNLGDVIANLNTEVADRQVAKYAYITGKTDRTYTTTGTDGYNKVSIDRFYRTTVRLLCNPFGLASSSTLSVRQAAILAALGFSRSQRKNPL
jgi:hypothetical protein